MSNFHLTILFLVIATLCVIFHFLLGSILVSIAGVTLFGVWSGAGAWCSYVGLINVAIFWMSCIQLSRLFDENEASARVNENLRDINAAVQAMNASAAQQSFCVESSCTCKS